MGVNFILGEGMMGVQGGWGTGGDCGVVVEVWAWLGLAELWSGWQVFICKLGKFWEEGRAKGRRREGRTAPKNDVAEGRGEAAG